MKKILLIGGVLLASGQFLAQTVSPTGTQNYIYSKNCLDADCIKKAETVQYFDGLGRPRQVVGIKASPAQKDVVSHIEYDQYGRQSKSFLPVPQTGTQNGAFYENSLDNATNPDIYGAEKIYSEQIIENAPLTRVKKSYNVGNAWADKPVTYNYNTNTSATEVKKYGISTGWVESRTDSQLSFSGAYYPVNSLMKTSVTDEDNNTTTEYKNGKGQTVLIRKNDGTQDVDTYYVYNEYSQLAFVLPPLASALASIDEAQRNSLCYQYRYDDFGRLVEKRIPGKGWEYLVYDKQDRVVLTQDAMLAGTTNNFAKKGWLFTKYDKYGRVVYTGFFANTASRSAMQTAINNMSANAGNNEERSNTPFTLNGMDVYYTKNAFPTGSMTVLSINYYDTYPPLPNEVTVPGNILGQDVLTQDAQNAVVSTKTLPTTTYTKNIEDNGWTKDFIWYDTKGRPIGSHSVNYLGGYTRTESLLDFAGMVQKTHTYHLRKQGETGVTVKERFVYDPQNRLLQHYHQVDGKPEELLAENTYNELSELKNKKVGNNLQSIDYAYNIRGWMTRINDPSGLNGKLFGYEVKYTDPLNTSASAKYNGNIAEVNWKTTNDGVYRRYNYTYDPLNRLLQGTYSEPYNSVSSNDYFNEMISYDSNGNIKTLKRFSRPSSGTIAEKIDDLVYNYENSNLSNRLASISLPAGVANNASGYNALGYTMGYDANGNMTSQLDKGISAIQYNLLNLASVMTTVQGTISYTYAADGTKLRKSSAAKTVDYLNGFQYETSQSTTSLQFIPTAEGYFDFVKNKYIYSYKDHLGNVRLSYFRNANGSAEVLEENNYYPFGLKHEGYNTLAGNNSYQYKYNGKELQETGMLDYGWRQYMPELGRWNGIDQLAEMYSSVSPFVYVGNNPINRFDPDGRLTEAFTDQIMNSPSGTTWYNNNNGSFTNNWGDTMSNDGIGGGSGPTPKNSTGPGIIQRIGNFFSRLFSSRGAGIKTYLPGASVSYRVQTGEMEGSFDRGTRLFGLIKNANVNSSGESPLEQYREWRDYSLYHEGESWLDRFARNVNSTHMDILQDEGSGGSLMFGGYGRIGNVAGAAEVFNPEAFAEEILNANRATEGGGMLLNGTPSNAINSALYYESAAEQGASIFRSISGGHMFIDGNKRTAVSVFEIFARQNSLNTVGRTQMLNVSGKVATGQVSEVSEIARMLIKK